MMSQQLIVQLVFQFGGFGVIALFFYMWMRRDWKRQDVEHEKSVEERVAHEKIVLGFTDTANGFQQVVLNHMIHEQEAFKELTNTINRLCIMWENNGK